MGTTQFFLKYAKYFLSLLFFIASYYGMKSVGDVPQFVIDHPFVVLSVLVALLIVILVQSTKDSNLQRQARYAYCLADLAAGFRALRQSSAHPGAGSPEAEARSITAALAVMCSQVAKAMSTVVGHSCSVCIKLISVRPYAEEDLEWEDGTPPAECVPGNELPFVVTLVRDTTSSSNRKPYPNRVTHWVHANTDFEILMANAFQARGRYFLRNELWLLPDYKNTAFRYYNKPPTIALPAGVMGFMLFPVIRAMNTVLALVRWTLPYRSTLIVPIKSDVDVDATYIGFLCIDSPKSLTFKVDFDVEVLEGVAEGICQYVERLRQLQGQYHVRGQ